MNLTDKRKLDPVRFIRELEDDLSRAFCRSFVNEGLPNLSNSRNYASEKKERVNV